MSKSVKDAVSSMVRISRHVQPEKNDTATYDYIYNEYAKLSSAIRPIVHSLVKLYDRPTFDKNGNRSKKSNPVTRH